MANICEIYPCHEDPCPGFNCDFCYCPLYADDCEKYGGNPEFIDIGKEKSIKDCSNCQLPHEPDFLKIIN